MSLTLSSLVLSQGRRRDRRRLRSAVVRQPPDRRRRQQRAGRPIPLARRVEAVQFDEFYHGLGVPGESAVPAHPPVLTRPSPSVCCCCWACGPGGRPSCSAHRFPTSRRVAATFPSIINAMGRFFAVGSQRSRDDWCNMFVTASCWQISEEIGLPPDTGDVDRIAAAVARRDVRRGEMLVEATRAVETELQSRRHWSESQTLDAMQRMTDCLSKNATRPSVPNSKKSSSVRTT